MGFALVGIGLLLTIAGARNTQGALYQLVQGDFTGSGNFFYWLGAIGIIGGLGYIPAMRGVSHAFLALVLLVLFLDVNKTASGGSGIFAELNAAIAGSGSTTAVDNSGSNSVGGQIGSLNVTQPSPSVINNATSIFQSLGQ